jgi:hypothetical protein
MIPATTAALISYKCDREVSVDYWKKFSEGALLPRNPHI